MSKQHFLFGAGECVFTATPGHTQAYRLQQVAAFKGTHQAGSHVWAHSGHSRTVPVPALEQTVQCSDTNSATHRALGMTIELPQLREI